MWHKGWRDQIWSALDQTWDLIIIGAGITGAGILREAARAGLRCLLVEAHDFASGTSSRSSKMVHGGFRYLKNFQLRLVRQSVSERERLIKEGRGLVNPLGFLLVNYIGDPMPGWIFEAGLSFYDLLALQWGHRRYDSYDTHEFYRLLTEEGLLGGYRYFDAQTDDARLVLRVIQEAVRDGGAALNYARVTQLQRLRSGQVCGVVLEDQSPQGSGRIAGAQAPIVINATGAWADELRAQVGQRARLRKLRGSHLIFSGERFPLTRAISFFHPVDGRPVFVLPWDGVTLLGTTDVDHTQPLTSDPAISAAEAEYLLSSAQRVFPDLELTSDDVLAAYSGIRPVVDTGKSDPSKESREHILWNESGLLTVAGGKLTTFRRMAHDALQKVRARLPGQPKFDPSMRVLDELPPSASSSVGLSPSTRLRLLGRHGANAPQVIAAAQTGELEPIAGTPALWAELRWAARSEGVVHLDDLLLRRVRLGLLLPEGGAPEMERVRSIAQPELGWSDERWQQEVGAYRSLWEQCYHYG
ncbi:MAG: glycerol-3-phosphate dehydrogenase/oxidase [Anaerolineales bacterium]|nr:glycerol-3-phosphate dehydrogenase/oxidase [Anaerolineales bacterium]